ncbi:MAG: cobyrinate a,c-diamide synthase, partial [Mycobacteriaceae bacterium]
GSRPRVEELTVPSRHLGLVTASEHGDRAREAVAAMTELVARHVEVSAVRALASSAVAAGAWSPQEAVGEPVSGRPVVAVAAGPAFTFGYAERDELLRAAGAEPVPFDPLTAALPDGSAALVLPGGFPELYGEELAANVGLCAQIRDLAARAPVHAECGGLTYLMSDLDGHPMCGVLAGSARFTERLTLGYRDAVAAADSVLYGTGQRVTGHEFHRTTVEFADAVQSAWLMRGSDGEPAREGALRAGVHASYLHTHPAAQPLAVRRFVERAGVH